jgi:uncharacterized protein
MPDPMMGESQDDFIERCMANDEANEDFPDAPQRLAFCFSKWEQSRSRGNTMERRFVPIESLQYEEEEDGVMSIAGVAALFRAESQDLGGFVEVLEPGAFDDAIMMSDVRGLFNHDPNYILGRTKSGTMELEVREDGLHYRIPNLPASRRDVWEAIQRGDVTGNSFAFTVERDRWEQRDGAPLRIIEKVRELFDVGPVVYPAYSQTVVSARCMDYVSKVKANPAPAAARRRRLKLIETEV